MASIKRRKDKFCVIYNYTDTDGKRKQKWETYATKAEAQKRKKEVEYKEKRGTFVIPQCKTMKDLLLLIITSLFPLYQYCRSLTRKRFTILK